MDENVAQLNKNVGRSILRAKDRRQDSESNYSDSEDGIEDNADMTAVSLFMGVMGINIRAQKAYMSTLKHLVKRSGDRE